MIRTQRRKDAKKAQRRALWLFRLCVGFRGFLSSERSKPPRRREGQDAYHLFRRVAEARPHEPQTYRAMAACLVEMKRTDLAIACYEVGLAGEWNPRFGDFRHILGLEYNKDKHAIATVVVK